MAKLLSHHDRFHVHALLGLSALIHFFLRFFWLFVFGEETFLPNAASAVGLTIHFLLHATSFQFHLPRNRQWSQPMIWKEFRVHNAIFAYRNLIGAALGCFAPVWWLHSPWSVTSWLAKTLLVFVTMRAADWGTDTFGSTEKRTTNAMPYPPSVSPDVQQFIKRFYAKAQFVATALAVCGTPVLAFGSVLAIEIASFLMTLVRKGFLSAAGYHILYSLSLFIMFPAMFVALHRGDEGVVLSTWRSFAVATISTTLRLGRLERPWGKYAAWGAAIAPGIVAGELIAHYVNPLPLCWMGALWSMFDTAQEYRMAVAKSANAPEVCKMDEKPQEVNPNEAPSKEGAQSESG